MRVTVCETTHEPATVERCWAALCEHTAQQRPSVVLLPEFAFLAPVWERPAFDPVVWAALVAEADGWLARLSELTCDSVIGAVPRDDGGRARNEAFLWSSDAGYRPLRRKSHLPSEPGFWERAGLRPGARTFRPSPLES